MKEHSEIYSVAVIGGGFSGLCFCNLLLKSGKISANDIILLEGNKRVGKKILATGNGRGNLTNVCVSPEFYHGDAAFASAALSRYSNKELIDFFYSLGLITCEENGKIYPASFYAGAIADVLRLSLSDKKMRVLTEYYVENIDYSSEKKCFIIKPEKKRETAPLNCDDQSAKPFSDEIFAEKVVVATGGSSGAGFLTDGKSYALLKKFGHKTTDLSPSLVQIKTEREILKGLKGLKQEVNLSLFGSLKKGENPRFIKSFCGDLLFCDYGVSGNAVFSLSAYLKGVYNPTLKIEFLPDFSESDLNKKLFPLIKNGVTMERLYVSVLPSRLMQTLFKRAGSAPADKANEKSVSAVNRLIKALILKIVGTLNFESSQVTAGGIDTRDIGADMQSKLKRGLYVIGEALNVDGDCGGYNLQWAFTSAAVCADEIF